MPLSRSTIKKLRRLQERVVAHAAKYNQGEWCGTQGCLAGFCATECLAPDQIVISHSALNEFDRGNKESTCFVPSEDYSDSEFGYSSIYMTARKYLNLEPEQADILFDPTWSGDAEIFNRRDGDSRKDAALKASARIEMFIASGGTL